MRPINNIVDITNFVMLEYGQPLHAFDINQVKGGKIVVENAKDGEVFTTLDGTERTLTDDMLLIKDAERGIAIAGVMGGLNSEIEEDTKTIIVESANFAGNSVRTTSKKLGLRTEASARFEKGIDPNLCEAAADKMCIRDSPTDVKKIEEKDASKREAEAQKKIEKVSKTLSESLDMDYDEVKKMVTCLLYTSRCV